LKGNVIGWDPDSNTGAISGYDGKRYDFTTLDWHSRSRPQHGDVVDFVADGVHAAQIYPIEPEYVPPSFMQFYFSLAGRISRSQYWLRFVLPVVIIGAILNGLAVAGGDRLKLLHAIFQLVILWPGIAVLVKRIHDRNKSGALVWWLYGPLVPASVLTIATMVAVALSDRGLAVALAPAAAALWTVVVGIGIWFFIEFGCMRGTVGANQYGPDPVPER
jgi:uncharacterized membrane protein YhaH (DUF805 family)